MFQWLMAKFYDKFMQLEFYPNTVKRLLLTEPSAYMRQKLREKTPLYKQLTIDIQNDKAESISLPDASMDAVVCTLVLCSVKNLTKALSEIHRILRPQGKLYFIEHVAATTNAKRYQWQRRLAFLWKHLFDGCCITRKTEEAITQAGFEMLKIDRQSMRGVPPIVRPSIRGIAIKGLYA